MGPEIGDAKLRWDRVNECLAGDLIPVVGPRRPVLLAPVEKQINDGRHRFGRHPAFAGLPHQLVVAVEGSFPVGAEIVLFAVQLDVPAVAVLAEPWLGESRHEKTLQLGKPWNHPGELKGLSPKRVAWQCDRPGLTLML